MSSDRLDREYNLIYDIPYNPTERLNQLANTIKDMQIVYGNRIAQLKEHIYRVINEIRDSKDPQRLSTLRNQLTKLQEDNSKLEVENESSRKNLEILEKYAYCRFFAEYHSKCRDLYSRITTLENERKTHGKRVKTRENRLVDLRKEIGEYSEKMQILHSHITSFLRILLPKKDSHYLELWERISFSDAVRDMEFNEHFSSEISFFNTVLSNLKDEKENDTSAIEARVCQELIKFLQSYKASRIVIPGVGKSIPEFIEVLEKANEKTRTRSSLLQMSIQQ